VRAPAADLDATDVATAVASGWGLPVAGLRYVALGGGSHHWAATADGARFFLTVDDLLDKPWLGVGADAAFRGLRDAFAAVRELRDRAGLRFVLAPLSSQRGEPVVRLTARYSLAVFPFLPAESGQWGDVLAARDRDEILRMLADLHVATPVVRSLVRPRAGEVYERAILAAALSDLDDPWPGGPFAEPARRALAARAGVVAGWLADFDRLAAHVAASSARQVVTHGEPHGGNIMRAGGRRLLIDWDTVALAPPERDLWMLDDGTAGALAAYTDATGRTADPMALSYYRVAWRLADLAGFTGRLRSAHRRDGNTEHAWASLQIVLGDDQAGRGKPYRCLPRESPG
jgi:spectinomycin phosphotransferase